MSRKHLSINGIITDSINVITEYICIVGTIVTTNMYRSGTGAMYLSPGTGVMYQVTSTISRCRGYCF